MPPLPITPTTPLLAHIRRVHRDCTLVTTKKIPYLPPKIYILSTIATLPEGGRKGGGRIDSTSLRGKENKKEKPPPKPPPGGLPVFVGNSARFRRYCDTIPQYTFQDSPVHFVFLHFTSSIAA